MKENVSHTATGRDLPAGFTDPVLVAGCFTCPTCGLVLMDGNDCDSCRAKNR
jgi:hypothetical protein